MYILHIFLNMHTYTFDFSQKVHTHVPVCMLAEGYSSNNQETERIGKAHFKATL